MVVGEEYKEQLLQAWDEEQKEKMKREQAVCTAIKPSSLCNQLPLVLRRYLPASCFLMHSCADRSVVIFRS